MRCEQIMKAEPECINGQDTVTEAAKRMRDQNIGFLPVCDDARKPVGTITDRDIVIRALADGRSGKTRVDEFMSRGVISVRATEAVGRAEELMAENRISRMVVVDDRGRVAGVISLSDLARREGSQTAQTLRRITTREVRAH